MNTTLTIKLPKELRDDAKKTAAAMGLPLSTVIHRQLREFVEAGEITFTTPVTLTRLSMRSLPAQAKQKLTQAKKTSRKDFVNL